MTNPRVQSLNQTLSTSFKDNSAELKNKSSLIKWNQSKCPKRGSIDTKRHLKRKLQLLHHEIHSHILLKIKKDIRLLVCSMNRNRGVSSLCNLKSHQLSNSNNINRRWESPLVLRNRGLLMTKAKLQARQRESNFQHIVN